MKKIAFSPHQPILICKSTYAYYFHINPVYSKFWTSRRLKLFIFHWASKKNKTIESYEEINNSFIRVKTVPNMNNPI